MNEIAFVIATDEFGAGPAEGVEPVIDGVSLVELMADAEGRISYAGLTSPELWLGRWQSALGAGGEQRLHLLGCGCGDDMCSHVFATMRRQGNELVLTEFWGSQTRAHASLGPFRFQAESFFDALSNPVRADRPVRRRPPA